MELLNFIDGIADENRHVVLFYENLQLAMSFQFRFIRNGLLRGNHCIYTTTRQDRQAIPEIEKAMADNGIDVDNAKKKKLLHIYSISNPAYDSDPLEGRRKLLARITRESRPPYVIVSTFNPEIDLKEQMEASIIAEEDFNDACSSFEGSLICSYDSTKLGTQTEDRQNWLHRVLSSHHDAIFVTKSGNGIALALR